VRKILIFASVAISLLLLTSTASASWWNVNWKYRREITITNVNGTYTDYQVLVQLNSSNFNFSHAQENGSDIRFVASDDETLLNHWIEVWNSTNQSAKIWVNVSEVTEGTKIFMYYGNENASDASNVNATFIRVIDGVVGAWHFDEGEGNIAHDTSGEGNDGTIYGGANWTDGKFGKALSFDGVNDYVKVPNSPSIRDYPNGFTWEIWFKQNTTQTNAGVVAQVDEPWFDLWIDGSGRLRYEVANKSDGITYSAQIFSDALEANEWYHAILVWNEGEHTLYAHLNGQNVGEYTNTNLTAAINPNDLNVGKYVGSFNGITDEFRIYNRVLSEGEISDLYNNYGYTTPNYPNKVLVRKYTEPEPIAIVGEEVSGIFTAIANFLTIEKEIGANYILWKWSCTNPDALVDVFVDGSEVLSAASAVSGEYLLTDVNENELHIIKIANSFNASDYVRDEARTLPPFSFFLALLLTTFVLLVITFATTSTVRVIASIFTLLFTGFTYKYSIYYASPLSYLLLFAFFFTFALMLVEVLRMLTSTIRKKPKWEEDFWSDWREGGGEL